MSADSRETSFVKNRPDLPDFQVARLSSTVAVTAMIASTYHGSETITRAITGTSLRTTPLRATAVGVGLDGKAPDQDLVPARCVLSTLVRPRPALRFEIRVTLRWLDIDAFPGGLLLQLSGLSILVRADRSPCHGSDACPEDPSSSSPDKSTEQKARDGACACSDCRPRDTFLPRIGVSNACRCRHEGYGCKAG